MHYCLSWNFDRIFSSQFLSPLPIAWVNDWTICNNKRHELFAKKEKLYPNPVLRIRDVYPGSGFWTLTHPGSRGQKGTGSWIRNIAMLASDGSFSAQLIATKIPWCKQAFINPINESMRDRVFLWVLLQASFSKSLIGQKSGLFHKENPLVYEYRLTLYTKTKRVHCHCASCDKNCKLNGLEGRSL